MTFINNSRPFINFARQNKTPLNNKELSKQTESLPKINLPKNEDTATTMALGEEGGSDSRLNVTI